MSRFVGFGMGAIQAGVYLPRADEAGFPKTVIVRRCEQAERINEAGGISLNIAGDRSVRVLEINGVEAVHRSDPLCLRRLTAATHVAVAVTSVADYPSIAPLLAEAIRRKAAQEGPPCLIYTSENNLRAAALLKRALLDQGGDPRCFQTLNTVIGKMSRTVRGPTDAFGSALSPAAPKLDERWLTEDFDEILVTRTAAQAGGPGQLPRMTECSDLRPFEDAKLHGHNAAHAALAFTGVALGVNHIAGVLENEAASGLVRAAFVNETGAALIRRYGGCGPLFSEYGWRAHGDDLFRRMGNPWLADECARVGRGVRRKLGWDDRFAGTVRRVEAEGVAAERWRAAMLCACEASGIPNSELSDIWLKDGAGESQITVMIESLHRARPLYQDWMQRARRPSEGKPHLPPFQFPDSKFSDDADKTASGACSRGRSSAPDS